MLDVSGDAGGGKILVGGDWGGGNPASGLVNNPSARLEEHAIPTATTVTVDGATTFNASATANGNGGKVILWSDVLTTFAGTIFARGGDARRQRRLRRGVGQAAARIHRHGRHARAERAHGTLLLTPGNPDNQDQQTRSRPARSVGGSRLAAELVAQTRNHGPHQAKVASRSGSGPNLNRRPVISKAITT